MQTGTISAPFSQCCSTTRRCTTFAAERPPATPSRSLTKRTAVSACHSRRLRVDNCGPRRPDQIVHDHHPAAGFESEIHAHETRRLQNLGDVLLVLRLAVEEKESAASRARHLATSRARGAGRLVP